MKWYSSSISFRSQTENFLLSLCMPLCLPVSIASECEDKHNFAKAALCLSRHKSFKNGAIS